MDGTAWLVQTQVCSNTVTTVTLRERPLNARRPGHKEVEVLTHFILTTTCEGGMIGPILQMAVINV